MARSTTQAKEWRNELGVNPALSPSCDWRIDKIISYQPRAVWRKNVRVCMCTNQGGLPGREGAQSAWGMHDCTLRVL